MTDRSFSPEEMPSRIRAFDWATTTLGASNQWPQSLRTAVDLMLGSGHAMQLAWGPQRILLYNDAYAPMLAERHPRALGVPLREAWPDVWNEIEPLVARVFAGETVRFEDMPLVLTRHGYPEQTWWNFSYSPVRDESGAVAGLLNVTVDATAKIRADRAEQALRERETQLRQVLDGMGEAFTLLDRDLRVVTRNDAALRLDGRALEATRGHTHAERDPDASPDVSPELVRLYERALSEGVPVSLEHRYACEDGHEKWLEVRAHPVPQGLAVFWRDISGRKAAEQALRESSQRQAFLLQLSDALRPLEDPLAVEQKALWMLRAHLTLTRAVYAEPLDQEGSMRISNESRAPGLMPMERLVPRFADFTPGAWTDTMAGRTQWREDVLRDGHTPEQQAEYTALGTRAWAMIPLVKQGRLVATLSVHAAQPRRWTSEELALIHETTERTSAAVERARAAAVAREAQSRLRLAGEAAQIGFWTWDLDTGLVEMDEVCRSLFDLPTDDPARPASRLPGAPDTGMRPCVSVDALLLQVHPADRDMMDAAITAAIEARSPYSVEFRVGLADRGLRWIDGKGDVLRDAHDRPTRMTGVARDVTVRHAAEAALRRSEERFRSMADTAPAMLWTTGQDNKLEFISRGWFNYTGQDEAAAYRDGLGWLDMVHEADRDGAAALFVEAANRQGPFELQYRLQRSDGSYRWAIDAGRPRHTDAGKWLGYIGSVVDIHDQASALVALREADRRKDEFLAMLAHELRNPLAPIRNALHLLTLAGDAVQTTRLHEMLQRQVGQLVRLVDDLMEASRISRDQLELKREPLDLVDVLNGAIETSRPAIEQSRHRLDFVQPSEPMPLNGDGVRLVQVFSNLLNNAAKYTDPGGHIEVAVGRVDGLAVVTVRDNGIGIAADQLPRVFEMFAQVDPSASRSRSGLGIGLALARKLVEMHGGRVEAFSDGPSAGSTFTVCLPLGGSGVDAADAVRTSPPPLARRVLVVDDNHDAADSLGMLLRFLGAEVLVEYGGADALTAVAAWRPSIVLLDLGMPGMDGFEVARRLRADPQAADVKLIALTGWGQEHDRLRTHMHGFDKHLIKPVDLNVLLALLTSLEERRATS